MTPPFQRRQVWKAKAKSLFIDTIYRGLPVPVVFLRERTELSPLRTVYEVVDGQQRLSTILAYVGSDEQNPVEVLKIHNKQIAKKRFSALDEEQKKRILGFKFSVNILPSDTTDADVLDIFARLNATGTKLNSQELRNAAFFGDFKTTVYAAAYEQLDRWRRWKLFTNEQLARMNEVELTSELFMYLISGSQAKSPKAIDDTYKKYDDEFKGRDGILNGFRTTLDRIDELMGKDLETTVFSRPPLFYALFGSIADLQRHGSLVTTKSSTAKFRDKILEASRRIEEKSAPPNVVLATERRTTHKVSRDALIKFLTQSIRGN